jgi:hypothetical protein
MSQKGDLFYAEFTTTNTRKPTRTPSSPGSRQIKWQPSGSPQRRGLPPSEGPTSHQTPHVSNGSFTENTSSTVSRNANIDANRDDVQTRYGGTVSNPGDKTNRINSNTVNSKNPEDGDRTNEVRKKSMPLLSKIRKFPKNTWTYMKKNPRKSTLIGGTVALCAIVSLCIAVHGFFPVVVGIGVLLGIVYIIKIAKITPALYQAYKARKSEKKP